MMDPGLTSPSTETPAQAPNGRRNTVTDLIILASSFAGGGTIVFAVLGLLRDQPERAFKLLQLWGPWCFLALFGSWILYKLLEPVVTAIVGAFSRISVSVEKQAESMGLLAAAVKQSADKDDRQVQEMQTLTALTAQRSEKTYSMMQDFHHDNQTIMAGQAEILSAQAAILKEHSEMLKRIESKVDQQAGEKSKT